MDDERLNVPTMTVHSQEECGRNTGVLDASGTPIYAFDNMAPIGFVHNFEKQEITMAKKPKPSKPSMPMKPSKGGKKGC
jgi:hypothetical protein